jgi:hypothetical protein
MLATSIGSAIALLIGLVLLRRFTGGRGRGAITVADLALLLACAEIVQLLYTLTKIDTAVGGPPAFLPICCGIGLLLAVAGSFAEWIATLVTGLGVAAAMVDTVLTDGYDVAGVLTLTVLLVWMINRLVRAVLPW